MTARALPFPALRAMATIVHAIHGAVGQLTWPEGRPIEVRAHPASTLQPCALRHGVAHAVAAGSCDPLSLGLGRRGEPSSRLVPGPRCRDLGGGVQRFTFARQVLDVFATDLAAELAVQAIHGAATLPASFRADPCHHPPRSGLGIGLAHDQLTRVSLVWLAHPAGDDQLDDEAAEAAWALAGACAATEATLGM